MKMKRERGVIKYQRTKLMSCWEVWWWLVNSRWPQMTTKKWGNGRTLMMLSNDENSWWQLWKEVVLVEWSCPGLLRSMWKMNSEDQIEYMQYEQIELRNYLELRILFHSSMEYYNTIMAQAMYKIEAWLAGKLSRHCWSLLGKIVFYKADKSTGNIQIVSEGELDTRMVGFDGEDHTKNRQQ